MTNLKGRFTLTLNVPQEYWQQFKGDGSIGHHTLSHDPSMKERLKALVTPPQNAIGQELSVLLQNGDTLTVKIDTCDIHTGIRGGDFSVGLQGDVVGVKP